MAKANTVKAAEEAAAKKAAAEATAKKAAEEAAAKKAADEAAVAAKAAAKQTVKVPALSVTTKREGLRRAGRAWSKEATVVKLSDLSKEQIAQIKGEALLTVTEVDIDEEVSE